VLSLESLKKAKGTKNHGFIPYLIGFVGYMALKGRAKSEG